MAVRFTDLHKYVTALPGFKDDPAKSNESKLEAIQMAWQLKSSIARKVRFRCEFNAL